MFLFHKEVVKINTANGAVTGVTLKTSETYNAQTVINALSPIYNKKIVTEISPLSIFYEAEKEHQAYYKNNQNSGYCSFVIDPKLQKLRTMHADKLID